MYTTLVTAVLTATLYPLQCYAQEPTDADQTWTDEATELMWQNPPEDQEMDWVTATAYCEELDLAGHTDWRLPNLIELRSLIGGCESTNPTFVRGYGLYCSPSDHDLKSGAWKSQCMRGCTPDEGPKDGCYWRDEMKGSCGSFWSSSTIGGSWVGHVGIIRFQIGAIVHLADSTKALARCVRGAS